MSPHCTCNLCDIVCMYMYVGTRSTCCIWYNETVDLGLGKMYMYTKNFYKVLACFHLVYTLVIKDQTYLLH